MSIQALKTSSSTPDTFESLQKMVENLQRQLQRTENVATALGEADQCDLKQMTRLSKTQEDNQKKLKTFQMKLVGLRKTDPENPLESQIAEAIDKCKDTIDQLIEQIEPIAQRHDQFRIEEEARLAERMKEADMQRQMQERQAQQNQHDDIAFVSKHAGDIVESMTELNDLNNQLAEKIDEQHEIVVHVDETIEEAKEEMIAGNQDLEQAEKDQKCCCCLVQ